MFKQRNLFAALLSSLILNLAGCASTFNPPPEWMLSVDAGVFEQQVAIENTASYAGGNQSEATHPVLGGETGFTIEPDPFLDNGCLERDVVSLSAGTQSSRLDSSGQSPSERRAR